MQSIRVRSISAVGGTTLRLTLSDGTVVERDVGDLLEGPVFEPLRASASEFARVRVEGGTAAWPNGADICPDVLIWGGRAPEREAERPPRYLAVPRPTSDEA